MTRFEIFYISYNLFTNYRSCVKVPHDKLLVFDPKDDDDSFFYHGVKQNNRDFTKKTHKDAHFSFDGVFGPEATNQEVFEGTTKAVVDAVLEGFNCSGFFQHIIFLLTVQSSIILLFVFF